MLSEEIYRRRSFCEAVGLDTNDYSFAYVARWSDGLAEPVKEKAERVIDCAKQNPEGVGGAGGGSRISDLRRLRVRVRWFDHFVVGDLGFPIDEISIIFPESRGP